MGWRYVARFFLDGARSRVVGLADGANVALGLLAAWHRRAKAAPSNPTGG
jgi:hypothetical protein